jgi:FKBP-type peptidyl-prolyl cis-trans isomerase 2
MNKILSVMFVSVFAAATLSYSADPAVAVGKAVKVDYTLTVNNEQLETSVGKEPLQFVVGDKTIIPGLESQLIGMKVGEEKLITVEPKDAYGEVDAKALKEFPKSSMPKEQEPKPGMVLQAQAPDGESFPAVIKEVKGDTVVLDFNHPLAGKQLKFQVKVLGVTDAPAAVAPVAPVKK